MGGDDIKIGYCGFMYLEWLAVKNGFIDSFVGSVLILLGYNFKEAGD